MNHWRRLGWIGLVAGCTFAGSWVATTIGWHWELQAQSPGNRGDGRGSAVTDVVAIGDRFELVARRVSPAVVFVEAKKPSERAGSSSAKMTEESGSGVLVRWEGRRDYLVLTNNHIIAGSSPDRIVVSMADGRVFQPAQVWADPETDVALLSITPPQELSVASLGDSDRMLVGHWVLAIGSPFGLNQTVTHGIISARERGQVALGATIRIKDFLQTDAAINPGNSGGPLINLNGEVIGINTAIASPSGGSIGLSFSIPSNLVRKIAGQLLEKGTVARGYVGIQLASGFEPAEALRLGLDNARGAMVEIVYRDTPGAVAGLRAGDVVVSMDGQPIKNENQLINMISAVAPGKKIDLEVIRERRRIPITIVVGEWSKGQEKLRGNQSADR